jgi:hypothetical protein
LDKALTVVTLDLITVKAVVAGVAVQMKLVRIRLGLFPMEEMVGTV